MKFFNNMGKIQKAQKFFGFYDNERIKYEG